MRARQFLKYNRELIRLFLDSKSLKETNSDGARAAAELVLQKIRGYADVIKQIAEKIRPDEGEGIEGETARYQKLGEYGVKPPEGMSQGEVTTGIIAESRKLKAEVDALPAQFVAAHRAKELERLRVLNEQAVALHKARMKAQLLEVASYLQEETINQLAVLMTLTAARLGYLRLSHEYGWRIRRALAEAAVRKIQVVGGKGRVAEVYDYQNFKMTTAEDENGETNPVPGH